MKLNKYYLNLLLLAPCCYAQAQFPTLEEIKARLESKKITVNVTPTTTYTEYACMPKGIINIQYNNLGEPIRVDDFSMLYKEVQALLPTNEHAYDGSTFIKNKFSVTNVNEIFPKISRLLSEEDLQKRGITKEDREMMNHLEVREITFDSIVDSCFAEKANTLKGYLEDEIQLKQYIENWVNQVPLLQTFTMENFSHYYTKNDDQSLKEEIFGPFDTEITYQVTNPERLHQIREKLKNNLFQLTKCKLGKEKIILMIAFDEEDSEMERLSYTNGVNIFSSSYSSQKNALIIFEDSNDVLKTFSHEIGHYILFKLGLSISSFNSYQDYYTNPFIKSLLCVHDQAQDKLGEQTVKIPNSAFLEEYRATPTEDSKHQTIEYHKGNLYIDIQMRLYWSNYRELQNIIGMFFRKDAQQKTYIGINRLADIDNTEYTHFGYYNQTTKEVFLQSCQKHVNDFKTNNPENQNEMDGTIEAITSILELCSLEAPSKETLQLLHKLHEKPYDPAKIIFYKDKLKPLEYYQQYYKLLPNKNSSSLSKCIIQ